MELWKYAGACRNISVYVAYFQNDTFGLKFIIGLFLFDIFI